jgi:DNA-binding FadR family transcriptional regulator
LALEPLVAGLAALRQEPTGMEELRSAMEILESPDEKDYIGQSERFHLAVAQASGGTILEVLAQALKEVWTSRVDARMLRNRVRPKFIYREAHIAIGQAILDGDASKSETLMRDHLTRYFALVDKQYPQIWDETIHV